MAISTEVMTTIAQNTDVPPVTFDSQPAVPLDHSSEPISERTPHNYIESHLGLAVKLALRFAATGIEVDDLIGRANLGLTLAAERFDPNRKLQFSTIATATIIGELKRQQRDESWGIRPPHS